MMISRVSCKTIVVVTQARVVRGFESLEKSTWIIYCNLQAKSVFCQVKSELSSREEVEKS